MTSESALAAPVDDGIMFTRGGARAAEVALAVRDVEDRLVVRVRVDRRHQAALDAEVVEQDLGDRREAVGRARAARDDRVLGRVVESVFTPRTMVASCPFAGALMMHLLGARRECAAWPSPCR